MPRIIILILAEAGLLGSAVLMDAMADVLPIWIWAFATMSCFALALVIAILFFSPIWMSVTGWWPPVRRKREQELEALAKLVEEAIRLDQSYREADPKVALAMFGVHLDVDKFRACQRQFELVQDELNTMFECGLALVDPDDWSKLLHQLLPLAQHGDGGKIRLMCWETVMSLPRSWGLCRIPQ